MFQAYREDTDDVDFKCIHIFKRIETCEKWAETQASLGKANDGAFDPTATMSARPSGHGMRHRPQRGCNHAREVHPDVMMTNVSRDEKYDARWVTRV
jgi:hypothetical protein